MRNADPRMTDKILETALRRCRAAWAKFPEAKWAWCCHHAILSEQLTEPASNRIEYILRDKAASEQVTRLNNFRPVQDESKIATLYADYESKRATLYADYAYKIATLYADYESKRAPLLADYASKLDPLHADYASKIATLYADYASKRAPLYADYESKRATLQMQKPMLKLYRHDVPLGTWNGLSIFPK